jgi:hypothetical protein
LEGECILDYSEEIMAYFSLFQLETSIAVSPSDTLAERIKALGEISTFATKLNEPEKMLGVFIRPPSSNDLHIIVKLPVTSELMLHFTLPH